MRAAASLAALAGCLALAAPAGAATVSLTPPASDPPGTPPEEGCARYQQCGPPVVSVRAEPGERNLLRIAAEGGAIVVRDAGVAPVAGPGCTARPDGAVRCPPGPVVVEAGDGDDVVEADPALRPGPAVDLRGGPGDDRLAGGSLMDGGEGEDRLTGTDGPDTLHGGPGADAVEGRGGDDTVVDEAGAPAPDRLDGGDGWDRLLFALRGAPVEADLGARPQRAGSAGEGNAVAGFEAVAGGDGDDELLGDPRTTGRRGVPTLAGGPGDDRLVDRSRGADLLEGEAGDDHVEVAAFGGAGGRHDLRGGAGDDVLIGGMDGDRLDGGAGADRLRGAGGADHLLGGPGADRLEGVEGDDRLSGGTGADVLVGGFGGDRLDGGPGDDRLRGEAGRDRLVGGAGRDRVSGGSGADVLHTRDRYRDVVDCGAGRDRLTADRRDRVRRCEAVRRSR